MYFPALSAPLRANIYALNFFSNSSNETPFVSGILVNTQINCNTIMPARNAKMIQGASFKIPFLSSFLAYAFQLYFIIVQARSLGMLYFKNRDNLGWF